MALLFQIFIFILQKILLKISDSNNIILIFKEINNFYIFIIVWNKYNIIILIISLWSENIFLLFFSG